MLYRWEREREGGGGGYLRIYEDIGEGTNKVFSTNINKHMCYACTTIITTHVRFTCKATIICRWLYG